MIDERKVMAKIALAIGRQELREVKALVGSETLKQAMQLLVSEAGDRADLFVPHYWAVWYHDGRGPVRAAPGHKLVFFEDHRADPRLPAGGRPVHKNQVRRLTKAEFNHGMRKNAERYKAGQQPYMIVVDSVGPWAGKPFFEELERGSAARASRVAYPIFDAEMKAAVQRDPATRPTRGTIDIRV